MESQCTETSDFINLLTHLSARENVTEFCHRENFKTCINYLSAEHNLYLCYDINPATCFGILISHHRAVYNKVKRYFLKTEFSVRYIHIP